MSPLLPQPPVSGYSTTRLRLRRVYTLLTEEVKEQQPSPLTHGRWPEGLLLVCSLILHHQGLIWLWVTTSIPIASLCFIYSSSAHSLLFHSAAITRMMLCVPRGLSGAQRVAMGGKGGKNAELSLTRLPGSSRSTGSSPTCTETVLCVFCPTQCTFPLIQTPGCIVPYILANQCQIFYSVFIPPVNRKVDSSVSCYLQTGNLFAWGKEEYFCSSVQSSLEKKKFPFPKSL